MQYTDAVLSVTPPGLRYFFNLPGAASADALLPPASVLTPLPGLIFRSPAARQRFQFVDSFRVFRSPQLAFSSGPVMGDESCETAETAMFSSPKADGAANDIAATSTERTKSLIFIAFGRWIFVTGGFYQKQTGSTRRYCRANKITNCKLRFRLRLSPTP